MVSLEERFARLEANMRVVTDELIFTRGKANGLEASMLVLARQWGNDVQTVIDALHQAMEVLDSPNSPGPSPEERREVIRVMEQVSSVLHSRNRS